MKLTVLSILLIILACNNNKEKVIPPFSGHELLAIADGGSLKEFMKLIDRSKFHITDSSWGRASGIEYTGYSTKDSFKPPNILEVQINKHFDVIYISFETKSKEIFLQIKDDFIAEGFKIKERGYGIEKFENNNNNIDIIMMNFEKTSKTFRIAMGGRNPKN
jgi:hypothetical protein